MDNNQLFNPALPADISADLSGLNRKQMLMQALLQRGMSPMEQPQRLGELASPVSPLAGILPFLQTMVASKGMKKTDEQGADLARRYNQSISDTLMASARARAGTPATEGSPATGPTEFGSPSASTPGTAAVPGDQNAANTLLINHPVTRQLGLDQMKRQMEISAFTDAAKAAGGGTAGTAGAPGGAGGPIGFGGPAGGTPMAVWLQGDPSGKAYLEALAKDNAPIAVREGDIAKLGPDGKMHSVFANPKGGIALERDVNGQPTTAHAIPGYAAAQGEVAGAEAGGKAKATLPYEIVPVEQAGGGIVQTPKATLLGNGLPAQSAVTPGVSNGAKVPAEGVWKSVPRRFIPSGMGQSTYNKTIAVDQANAASKLSTDMGTLANAANQRLALNQQSLELVDKAETGPLSTQIADVKSYLIKFVPGLKETDFAGTVEANQALAKDLINAATQTAKANYGSRITQSEVMLQLKRGSPSGDMVKGAIKYLINSDIAKAQYQMDQAEHLGKYISMGGDPQRFEAWHAKAFPMSDYLAKAGVSGGGKIVTPNGPKGVPGKVDAESGAIVKPAAKPGQGSTGLSTVPEGVDPKLWDVMTPGEKALWKQ